MVWSLVTSMPNSIKENFLDDLLNKTTWNKDRLNYQNYITQTESYVSIQVTTHKVQNPQWTSSSCQETRHLLKDTTVSSMGLGSDPLPDTKGLLTLIMHALFLNNQEKGTIRDSGSTDSQWACYQQKAAFSTTFFRKKGYGQRLPIYMLENCIL